MKTLALAIALVGLVGCAATPSEEAASSEDAVTAGEASCGASYAVANEHYKTAVALAKQRKIEVCAAPEGMEGESYLSRIAVELQLATNACGEFKNIIKTSPWAAPIREEMAGSLALPVLTGDLEVSDASGGTSFSGLAETLEKGITLWGPAPGAYGNMSRLDFGPKGTVKIAQLGYHDGSHVMWWKQSVASYRLGNVDGDAVLLVIEREDGTSTDYELRAKTTEQNLPDFELSPIEQEGDVFTTYASECG